MHCTDTKRETLYIKEDNEWSKDKAKEKIKGCNKKSIFKKLQCINGLEKFKSRLYE